MASGNFSKYPVSGFGLYCEWTSTPNNVENKSSVTVNVYLKYYSLTVGSRSDSTIVCNGVTHTYTAGSISTSSTSAHTTLLGSHTFTVNHNSDGKKSISISASWRFSGTYSGTSIGTITASTTAVLDNIPRNSTITSVTSPVTINGSNTVSVSINRHSSSYNHKVKFELGSYSQEITGVSTSTSYAIPLSWLNAIPNSMSSTAKVTVTTYSGNTQIGSSVSKDFIVKVPDTVVPSIEGITWIDLDTRKPNTWPSMVQNVSFGTLNMQNVSAPYSATIKSYSLSFGGFHSTSSSLIIARRIPSSGQLTATAKVTDSRGQSATKTVNFTVTPYELPKLNPEVFRCDSSGNEDAQGEYISFNPNYTITSLGNLNSLTSAYIVLSNGEDEYTYMLGLGGVSRVAPASSDYSWNWTMSLSDVVSTVEYKGVVGTGEVIVDILADGKGLALGKVADKQGFDANEAWLPDWIVAKGTASMGSASSGTSYGTWTWRKWASGIAECWGTYSDTVNHSNTTTWGAMYTTADEFAGSGIDLPSGLFITAPVVNANIRGIAQGLNAWLATRVEAGEASSSKTQGFQLIRPTAFSKDTSYHMSVHAIGTWK